MAEYEITAAADVPLVIGATGLEGLKQCLRIIISTPAFLVPLDRAFAHAGSFIDSPLPHQTTALIAELTEAIERFEPRVKVSSISLPRGNNSAANAMDGRLFPVITFKLKEGVVL